MFKRKDDVDEKDSLLARCLRQLLATAIKDVPASQAADIEEIISATAPARSPVCIGAKMYDHGVIVCEGWDPGQVGVVATACQSWNI